MERRVTDGRIEVVIKLDGVVETAEMLQNTLTRLDEELGKLKQKVEDTNKLMADVKNKLFTIWAK